MRSQTRLTGKGPVREFRHHKSTLVQLVRANDMRQVIGGEEAIQGILIEHVACAALYIDREAFVRWQLEC